MAIVGAGPIGLAAIMTAKLFTPGKIVAIDLADARLDKALEFGADVVINNGREDALTASRSSRMAWAPTSPSRRWASRRRSSSAPS